MQNDFVREGRRALLVPDAEATIPEIRALLEFAPCATGCASSTARTPIGKAIPSGGSGPSMPREGSWGWEIVDELAPAPDDVVPAQASL